VACILGAVEDASDEVQPPFDAILCHAVLMYVEKPATCLGDLRSLANRGAILSLLEKNKDGIALRPGLSGDYREAKRLLDDAVSTDDSALRTSPARSKSGSLCSHRPAGMRLTGRACGCSRTRLRMICLRRSSTLC
jgi:hypothetical protein